jgi:hypothetical protein
MPDEAPVPPPEAPRAPIPFHIGEEFGTAKKNLPPTQIILIGVAAVMVVAAIVAFIQRPRPAAAGTIDNIVSVDIPDQKSVMVAVNVSFQNTSKKVFKIHNMEATLETDSGPLKDDAASGADFERYFQAFPALKEHALPPLEIEDKIAPGASANGTIVVSFPVTQDAFAKAKSFQVSIWPYDESLPLVLTKKN